MLHTLLAFQSYADDTEGDRLLRVGRDRWTFRLVVEEGGPVTVAIQDSYEDDDDWQDAFVWTAVSADVDESKDTFTDPIAVTLRKGSKYVRAEVRSVTGSPVLGVTADARIFDPVSGGSSHSNLLSVEARSWTDALDRIASEAEHDVVGYLSREGFLSALDPDHAEVPERLRLAAARLAEDRIRKAIAERQDPAVGAKFVSPSIGRVIEDTLYPVLLDVGWRGR